MTPPPSPPAKKAKVAAPGDTPSPDKVPNMELPTTGGPSVFPVPNGFNVFPALGGPDAFPAPGSNLFPGPGGLNNTLVPVSANSASIPATEPRGGSFRLFDPRDRRKSMPNPPQRPKGYNIERAVTPPSPSPANIEGKDLIDQLDIKPKLLNFTKDLLRDTTNLPHAGPSTNVFVTPPHNNTHVTPAMPPTPTKPTNYTPKQGPPAAYQPFNFWPKCPSGTSPNQPCVFLQEDGYFKCENCLAHYPAN